MERQRQRDAERRPGRVTTPEAKRCWNRAYKLKTEGLTPERFAAMLEAQGYACAMCREPFGDQTIFAGHDHACCRGTRTCGRCVRGLPCLTCNVGVGYVETYGAMPVTAHAVSAFQAPWGWRAQRSQVARLAAREPLTLVKAVRVSLSPAIPGSCDLVP